ncbi:DUF2235 domain-containing protein [Luteolibacter sp. Populi]|uniref:T6SS phospholipase effector Tle1-like catalytic domain-containing protein n=1 Tax=Luteolibacter sp. Populi TaxID=3230487 RepID=UPI003465642A
MKNIVICCDGTNNQLHGDLTNVVRLFEVALKDERQVAFYDPGVGTTPDPLEKGQVRKRWSMVKGLAFGAGLEDNVLDAYRWLINVYTVGDRIFIFGFSRGAFTARVLAGMLHAVGLLHPGSENLLPYLWRAYRKIRLPPANASASELREAKKQADEIAVLRRSFTRNCPIHFLGPWDTVGSVGMYNWNQSFPYSFENQSVSIVRHAMALDERRAAFRSNAFKADPTPLPDGRPRVMNVWFPGVHSDIGGGYPWPAETALAMIPFQWMLREAMAASLLVDQAKLDTLSAECPPSAIADRHESLKGAWVPLEYVPARRFDWKTRRTIWRYQPNKPRILIESPWLHRSILERIGKRTDYRPPNLPDPTVYPVED